MLVPQCTEVIASLSTVDASRATHDVVVVGGGLTGLTAAWTLRDRDVLLLEESERFGGRIRSERRGPLSLNLGAHVFGGKATATGRLLDALAIKARDVPGALAALSLDGRLVAGGPVQLLCRLPLSLRERATLARSGLRLRLAVRRYAAVAQERPGESAAARQQRLLDFMDDRSFTSFIGPLPPTIDALYRCTLTRSSGEPEELAAGYGVGYFHLVWNREGGLGRNIPGGPATITDALAAALGPRARRGARVIRIAEQADGVAVTYVRAGERRTVQARAVVVATPADVTRTVVQGLPNETDEALGAIRYGPYVVGAIRTNETEPSPWDGLYAVATPKRSFSMAFNMANVLRGAGPRVPGSSFMVYAAAGLARQLDGLRDEEVAARFVADLNGVFPGVGQHVVETQVLRLDRGLPHPTVGRGRLQTALTRDLGRIALAGDYLGSWYTDTCVATAEAAAASARRFLD